MIPFAFSALLLILFAVERRRLKLLWQLAPVCLLSLWYLGGRFIVERNADGQAGMISAVRTYSAAFWAYKVNSYLKSFGFINVGTAHGSVTIHLIGLPVFLTLFLLNLILCSTIAWSLVRAARSAFRERRRERFVWKAAAFFFLLFLLAPGTMLGVSDPGARLLQTMLAVVLFQCFSDAESSIRVERVAVVCAAAIQVLAVFQFDRIVFSPERPPDSFNQIPHRVIVFSHVPDHVEDYFYDALERGDMRISIFPTALFMNTPKAEPGLPEHLGSGGR